MNSTETRPEKVIVKKSDDYHNASDWKDKKSRSNPICNGKNQGRCEPGTLS